MDIGCMEVVVERKNSPGMKFLYVFLIMMAIVFIFIGLVGLWPAMIIGVGCGVGAWFASKNIDIDYEYDYVEKELRVAKIMRKESRKNLGTFDLDKMEICAPASSYRLDNYHHKDVKVFDYSSHMKKDPDPRFEIYFSDQKLVIEPDKELLKVLRQTFPSKVYTEGWEA
jgi:hypothetical protein